MHARLLLLVLIAVAPGCRSAAVPPATAPARTSPTDVAAPADVETRDPSAIRWVRDSAEYRALVMQAYRLATLHVEREAAARRAGSWAVILDADETVISNLTYQIERTRAGLGFTPESWYAWVRREEATPLPGAAAFLARVRGLGGRIAIVTNRRMGECDATVAVFRKYALAYDAMLCRPDEGPSDKTPRFDAVVRGDALPGSGPLAVVAVLGDNIFDFPGLSQGSQDEGALSLFGERYFVLPNPMYGSWER